MHQAEQYFCPVPTCERATRPFPREYNMCDHINRVHKELDANTFMKKTSRRSKKSKTGGSSGVATPVNIKVDLVNTPRKSSNGRSRRDKYQKKYDECLRESRDILMRLEDPRDHNTKKHMKKLRDAYSNLEDALRDLLDVDND